MRRTILGIFMTVILMPVFPGEVSAARLYGTPARPVAMPQAAGGAFRHFVWGVSKEDVRRFESAVFYKEEEDSLYFIDEPSPKDFRRIIRYDFRSGKLWRANYEFQDFDDANTDTIMNIHEDVKRALSTQYGQPVKEDFIWKDRYYRNHPVFWGRTLISKDLRLKTQWQQGDTKVTLDNYFISPDFYLGYTVEQGDTEDTDRERNILNLIPVAGSGY